MNSFETLISNSEFRDQIRETSLPPIIVSRPLAQFMNLGHMPAFDPNRPGVYIFDPNYTNGGVIYSLPLLLKWWQLYLSENAGQYLTRLHVTSLPQGVSENLGLRTRDTTTDTIHLLLNHLYRRIDPNYLHVEDLLAMGKEFFELEAALEPLVRARFPSLYV